MCKFIKCPNKKISAKVQYRVSIWNKYVSSLWWKKGKKSWWIMNILRKCIPNIRTSDSKCKLRELNVVEWNYNRSRLCCMQPWSVYNPRWGNYKVTDVGQCKTSECLIHNCTKFKLHMLTDRQPVKVNSDEVRYMAEARTTIYDLNSSIDQPLQLLDYSSWKTSI